MVPEKKNYYLRKSFFYSIFAEFMRVNEDYIEGLVGLSYLFNDLNGKSVSFFFYSVELQNICRVKFEFLPYRQSLAMGRVIFQNKL